MLFLRIVPPGIYRERNKDTSDDCATDELNKDQVANIPANKRARVIFCLRFLVASAHYELCSDHWAIGHSLGWFVRVQRSSWNRRIFLQRGGVLAQLT